MKTPKHLRKVFMWHKVKELKGSGLNISQISRQLDLDRATVRKYLGMDEFAFYKWIEQPRHLPKKLQEYYSFIKEQLDKCNELSAAQVEDRLKEKFPDLPEVHSKTVYNFVQLVRKEHGIKKQQQKRDMEKLPEEPYGKQAQVDFGEFNMRTDKYPKKVYFFAMVLSRSRQKFIHFRDHPFTSESAIESHNLAFEFYGGQPKEVLYDQDKVFMVDENMGDLVLTSKFTSYCKEMDFKPVFCRKADPQSKGKIENVVGYVKKNFLKCRRYTGINNLNEEVMSWLSRTGNGKVHAGILKVPQQEWLIERSHLIPYHARVAGSPTCKEYLVRKDNTINYHANFYTLPMGTYQGNSTRVLVREEESKLLVFNKVHELLTVHELSYERGLTIRKTDHRRDKSKGIDNMKSKVKELLGGTEEATSFIDLLSRDKGRYLGDNLRVLLKKLPLFENKYITRACKFCLENNVYNAFTFIEVAIHEQKKDNQSINLVMPLIDKVSTTINLDYQPKASEISIYESIM